jgi:hypothetical protein
LRLPAVIVARKPPVFNGAVLREAYTAASIAAEFLLRKKGVIDKNVRWESYTTVEVKARVLKTARRQAGDAMNLAIARHQSEDGS